MDSSSLNICCPEHNQFVQYVCLENQCYQKLMCEVCLKKHKDVHKNQHTSLIEMINNFRMFLKIKLEKDEDMAHLNEQVRNGTRGLRGTDGKQSEINFLMFQHLNGKDWEVKQNLFNDKAQKKKSGILAGVAKSFTNSVELFVQREQKKILNFEKCVIESMQTQLRLATTRRVLDEKFIKDSAIQSILDDLKNPNDRYNKLSKNLRKLHRGQLELSVSKRIFGDLCKDGQIRLKTFSRNLDNFFEQECHKLFDFMLDNAEDIRLDREQVETVVSEIDVIAGQLNTKFIRDKGDPNAQMTRMIEDLRKINSDTKKISEKTEQYPSSSTPQDNENIAQQLQFYLPRTRKAQPINSDLLRGLDYQKKEVKLDLERIEITRFAEIKHRLFDLKLAPSSNSNITSIDNDTITSTNNPSKNIRLSTMVYLYSVPQGSVRDMSVKHTLSVINRAQNQSMTAITPRNMRSVNFRIHTSTSDHRNINRTNTFNGKMLDTTESLYGIDKTNTSEFINTEDSVILGKGGNNRIDFTLECDLKHINLLSLVTNPHMRAYGYLHQLKLPFSMSQSHPFSRQDNQKVNEDKQSQQSIMILGLEEISLSRFILISQNGSLQVWQVSTPLDSHELMSQSRSLYYSVDPSEGIMKKMKELVMCKSISCYKEVNRKELRLDLEDESEIILFVCGIQEESTESLVMIVKYESKKNRFFVIDSIPSGHSQGVSCMEVIPNRQFKRNNLPTPLQTTTDSYYLYTLNLFYQSDDSSTKKVPQNPTEMTPSIIISRVSFHREKHNSTERTVVMQISIKQNIIIQRLLFDEASDCLWGHSDYLLFKWRVNFLTRSTESQESLALCLKPNDIITSMLSNGNIIMLSSLHGSIWGIDVMLNKVIQSDCQRYKYSSINNYAKIQGKDPIYILSGSKILTKTTPPGMVIPKIENYFLYSTISSSGLKVFAFNSHFKDLAYTLAGQQNHLQKIISLNQNNYILALEDFTSIKMWTYHPL